MRWPSHPPRASIRRVTDPRLPGKEVSIRLARAFAAAFAAAEEAPAGPARDRELLLGPVAVWRTVRAVHGEHTWAQRCADIGYRLRAQQQARATEVAVDASAPGAVVVAALWALARGERSLRLGPKTARWRAATNAALATLPAEASVVLEPAGEPLSSALHVGATERLRVVVAPYYYAPGDLERVALAVALELCRPSPEAEAGLELQLPLRWDQRLTFLATLSRLCAALGVDVPEPVWLDADAPAELLDAARERASKDATLSVFLYPMWREQQVVERALDRLLEGRHLATVNETPAMLWALGHGARHGSAVLDADQRLRAPHSTRAILRRVQFESAPSWPRGISLLSANWLGV